MKARNLRGLPQAVKDQLIQRALEQRLRRLERPAGEAGEEPAPSAGAEDSVMQRYSRFDLHPTYLQMQVVRDGAERLGIANPYFRPHEGIAGATTVIDGRTYLNFASYNYLGLNGDPEVAAAAKRAIDTWGTSVSASRLVSGERPVHRALEEALAQAHDSADCVAFVSGHATNVSTIAQLFGPRDLVLHDAFAHNSILLGVQLSGAKRMLFPHNDWRALDAMLATHRRHFERALVVIEGLYSMDGDVPELPEFIRVKARHNAFLMVDEAHSFGVLGASGLGIREHFGLAGSEVDIWMGTLSKTLAGCGGYVAGNVALIEQLKYAAAGFLYSVGMAPPLAAASLAALERMLEEPGRVARLHENGARFLAKAREAGIDTGLSAGVSVIPAITGSSIRAGRLAQSLYERGINVQPIVYPAVAEQAARLRFFVSAMHSPEQIDHAVATLAAAWHER